MVGIPNLGIDMELQDETPIIFRRFSTPLKPGPGGLESRLWTQAQYIIRKPTSSSTYTISQIFRMHILPVYDQLPTTLVILILIMNLVRKVLNDSWAKFDFHKFA